MNELTLNDVCRRLACSLLLVVLCIAVTPHSPGQTAQPTAASAEDSIALLRGVIERRTVERDRLRRMLAALNQIDSVYRPLYPAWQVVDADLRERVRRTLRLHGNDVPPEGEVVVVANNDGNEILDLSMGSARMGRLDARQILADSLHAQLLYGDYQRRPVEPDVQGPRSYVLVETPQYAALTASAFAVRLLFAGDIGLEAVIGREELGYHFWSSGDFAARLIFKGLKAGVLLPFPYGYKTRRTIAPLAIKPTLLAGSTGFSGEFEQPFGNSRVGARLSLGELYLRDFVEKVPDSIAAYSLHTTAQVYYGHRLQWNDDQLLLTAGIGAHQVTLNMTDRPAGKVVTLEKQNYVSPLLRVDYTRCGDRLYGGSLQYYNSIVLVSGWVEIIRNFLFLDLKYYTPVFRDPEPWEQKYFFMVSPRLQISY